MNEFDEKIVRKFKALIAEKVDLFQLILFGSRARGDADEYSDYDVLVIVNGPVDESLRDYISDCAWEVGFKDALVIIPIVYPRDEWEFSPIRRSILALAVRQDGITI